METLLFIAHVFSCLFLIGLILIQRSQGADIGAAFGGASQTVFGSRGPATFLNKLTVIIAIIFLGASLVLAHLAKERTMTTVVDEATKLTQEEGLSVTPGDTAKETIEDEGKQVEQEKLQKIQEDGKTND